jgi:hypothetical protein
MEEKLKPDPVIESLNSLVNNLENNVPEAEDLPDLPTREDIINIHLAAIKTILLLES